MTGMYVCEPQGGNIHAGMYVCYWYVCMSGETYIPRKLEVSMYVKGMYVCLGKQTYLEN